MTDATNPGRALAVTATTKAVIGALVLFFALVAGALVHFTGAERAARTQVEQTSEILALLRASLRTGLDAETGQRGYLLTEDTVYLEPYARAESDWLARIATLRALVGPAATPEQAGHLDRMQDIAERKLEELALTIDLTRQGRRDEALAVVTSDLGQQLMDDFRSEVAQLEDIEQRLLDDALAWAARVEARTVPLLIVLAAVVLGLVIYGLSLERRTARAEAGARDVEALRRARERSDLLSQELNHRVKNLFSVVLAIVSLSGRGETDVKTALRKVRERIHALAQAHAISQGESGHGFVDLREIVEVVLAPYAAEGGRIERTGPSVELPVRVVTPLGLTLHELATNAVKYGGLSRPDGTVSVAWDVSDAGEVSLEWRETGAPAPEADDRVGFGTVMMRQAAAQMHGEADRGWDGTGMRFVMTFPLRRHDPDAANGSAA